MFGKDFSVYILVSHYLNMYASFNYMPDFSHYKLATTFA